MTYKIGIMDYNELVQKRQESIIDDLEFLLAQEELAEIYLEDMKSRGEQPNNENAVRWLCEYENNNLYGQL